MPFVKILDKEPPTDKEILLRNLSPFMTGQDVYIREMFSQHWSENKELSLQTEWLDESAPTEDMVKDLMWEQTGQTHKADTPFGAYTVYLSPYTNEWHVGQLYLNFYGECDDLAHGIALCNQHHKKIILSQLK